MMNVFISTSKILNQRSNLIYGILTIIFVSRVLQRIYLLFYHEKRLFNDSEIITENIQN